MTLSLGNVPITLIIIYIRYVKNRHRFTTRASINMDLSTPLFNTKFLASGTRLWNNLDSATRGSHFPL